MGNARNKKMSDGTRLILFLSIIIVIVFGITVLPTIQFNGNAIRMFAPERLEFSGRGFNGRVFGTHVLETYHGEITLKDFARVFSDDNTIIMIDTENFTNGRASHNLVIDGIEMPKTIGITFSRRNQRQFTRLQLYNQEIILSGIPISVTTFDLEHPNHTADIVMGGATPISGYISLADDTQINFVLSGAGASLRIYKDNEQWMLFNSVSSVFAKRLGEDEFTRYRSITFSPDWGPFIEGIPFE